tara:strand:- start:561 stop:1046 length:486 start_codon:yes stop_codon:yes gene_type:complete
MLYQEIRPNGDTLEINHNERGESYVAVISTIVGDIDIYDTVEEAISGENAIITLAPCDYNLIGDMNIYTVAGIIEAIKYTKNGTAYIENPTYEVTGIPYTGLKDGKITWTELFEQDYELFYSILDFREIRLRELEIGDFIYPVPMHRDDSSEGTVTVTRIA